MYLIFLNFSAFRLQMAIFFVILHSMSETYKSVYRQGAEDGLLLAPLLIAASLCMGASIYRPMFFLPTLIFMIAVPVVTYISQLKSYLRQPELSTLSALWLQGICMFFFASLIMGLAVYAAMRWIWPGFINDQVNAVIQLYSSSNDPDITNLVKGIERARDTHSLPSPIDITLELMYMVVFTGSLLSLVSSVIARAVGRNRRHPRPPKYNPDN